MALDIPEIPGLVPAMKAVRKNYPTPLGDQHGAFLIALCRVVREFAASLPDGNVYKRWLLRAGLLKKSGGTRVSLPKLPGQSKAEQVSQDCMAFPTETAEHYDVLQDGENKATPYWGDGYAYMTADRYLDIAPWVGAPVPDPPSPPVPPSEPDPPSDPVPGLGEVIELLTAIELRNEERHEAVAMRLDRLANAMRKSRTFEGSARFIGTMRGAVEGVEV